ncbi:hypothetical protein V6N13_120586 [Hibiscus sabdariffa]|uniref:GRF-type domain-containing protein n=1 Tax=Hibiscus sabdariffa TaxID=183260 RepID=A0ABR2E4P3_9ROSI
MFNPMKPMEAEKQGSSEWSAGMEEPISFPICGCGYPAKLTTSWSNRNPGRRFFGCKNYGSFFHKHCRFFCWYDPPISTRSRIVLVGLLNKIKANDIQRRNERFGWIFLLVVCVVLLWFSMH